MQLRGYLSPNDGSGFRQHTFAINQVANVRNSIACHRVNDGSGLRYEITGQRLEGARVKQTGPIAIA